MQRVLTRQRTGSPDVPCPAHVTDATVSAVECPAGYSEMQAKETKLAPSAHERYKMAWDEKLSHPSIPIHHDKAAVLLLSWDESQDDLKVKPEVCPTSIP